MRGLVAAALAVVVVAPAVEAQPIDLERALALPISPGAVALLVEGAHEPRARQRLVEALADERAEVRAAAARVVDASGTAQLVPDVTASLAKESDPDAAIEMLRAIANLGDVTGDSVLIEASRRLGLGNVAGPALAAGRGAPALEELDSFRAGKGPSFPLKDVLRLASRGNRDVLAPLVAKAFREGDVDLWAAYLELARDTEARVSDGDLLFGLSSDTFRVETLWHILLSDVQAPGVEARANELVAERETATDVEDQFLRELLARKRGDKPRESREWIARRSSNQGTKLSGIRELPPKPVLALLTKDERRALSAQMTGDPEFLDEERKRAEKAASLGVPVAPRATTGATGTLRAVARFPPGFAADLLEVTDCHPRCPGRNRERERSILPFRPTGASHVRTGIHGGTTRTGRMPGGISCVDPQRFPRAGRTIEHRASRPAPRPAGAGLPFLSRGTGLSSVVALWRAWKRAGDRVTEENRGCRTHGIPNPRNGSGFRVWSSWTLSSPGRVAFRG